MQDALPSQLPDQDIPTHPEEMKTSINLRVGNSISLQGSARITPAGIITVGLTVSAIAFAFGYLARSTPRCRTWR
ncbi:hypothetical protein [Bosea sp. BK604]|uniref:hypothetical protein n=1 Tax=Bosea sp. BK604 TaxID=2512180 RepID=UPI001043BD26|nr:hypothetical protein [Bosea sp. BK604]TCR62180.1 hypothetical protein EV560_111168 [Bosea sp. BK604]